MILLTSIYLLVFTSTVCFGYKPFAGYSEFRKTFLVESGGPVFQLAPDEEFKLKGVVGTQGLPMMDQLGVLGGDQKEKVFIGCYEFAKQSEKSQPYFRLSIRISGYGYNTEGITLKRDDLELDEFVVNKCMKAELKKLVEVSRIGTNKYALTFKDTSKQCFVREIEVIEGELTLTVRREEPVEQDCSVSSGDFQNLEGRVVPKSWMDNGELIDVDVSRSSRFDVVSNLEDKLRKTTSFACTSTENIEYARLKFATVLYKGIPIDHLYSKTCSMFLDDSILREKSTGSANEVYINYMNTKGVCLRRKYEISMQRVDGDDHLRHVTVRRHTPEEAKCPLLIRFRTSYYRTLRTPEQELLK